MHLTFEETAAGSTVIKNEDEKYENNQSLEEKKPRKALNGDGLDSMVRFPPM